ncbi:hypothetical protein RB195_018854 [Necator americanus]|uniref:Uncharacterized protein n=1 Tax=Necator americanus TaxID=51031 RepID=A0ABR1CDN6_NECAM
MGKLARKMGIIHREPTKQKPARINETHADQQTATESTATEETEEGSSQNDAIWLSEDNSNSEKSRKDDEDFICRALKPKQLRLPRFYGDEEEFPEFWAIYETLVDQRQDMTLVTDRAIKAPPIPYQLQELTLLLGINTAMSAIMRFKNGNESLEDEEHGSRPQVVDDQVLKSVIELDPRQTTRELATHFG